MAKYNYRAMTPGEFARNLDDTQLTLSQFCRLIGADYDEVREGMLQARTVPIPHHFRLFFLLSALPGGIALARQITDSVIEKTEDFNPHKAAYGHGQSARDIIDGEATVERKFSVEKRRR